MLIIVVIHNNYKNEQKLLLNQLEQLNDSDQEKFEKYWNILAYNRNIHMKDTLLIVFIIINMIL